MILFFKHDVVFEIKNKRGYKRWLNELASRFGKRIVEISIVFCSDTYMEELNRRFLGHDYPTDVITFDTSSLLRRQGISGDIYIGIERVVFNAEDYCISFKEELLRVMAHGLLHLLGHNDATDEERLLMHQQEDAAIACFKDHDLNR